MSESVRYDGDDSFLVAGYRLQVCIGRVHMASELGVCGNGEFIQYPVWTFRIAL